MVQLNLRSKDLAITMCSIMRMIIMGESFGRIEKTRAGEREGGPV